MLSSSQATWLLFWNTTALLAPKLQSWGCKEGGLLDGLAVLVLLLEVALALLVPLLVDGMTPKVLWGALRS